MLVESRMKKGEFWVENGTTRTTDEWNKHNATKEKYSRKMELNWERG